MLKAIANVHKSKVIALHRSSAQLRDWTKVGQVKCWSSGNRECQEVGQLMDLSIFKHECNI